MDPVAVLKASPLFKGFTDTGLQIIGSIGTFRSYPKGVPIFVENMLADALYVLETGKVQLTTRGKAGEETPIGELGPGEYLGELSLIQQGQRMCTATCTSQVTAVEIRHADFQKLLATKPQACLKLLMSIVSLFGQKVLENKETLKGLLNRP
jgi:CRP/FNR family transcriptional regulator, cyclic AMP receptor protein